jgi:uncharacterized protein YndB with AHSA1/START domain
MPELILKQSVEINAPASKVWEVLISAPMTRQWIGSFGIEGEIVSDWKLGDPVQWKGQDGTVFVEGNVTAVDPEKLLRFTVFDTRSERPPVTDKDGITYELSSQNGKTTLTVKQGDFGKMADGEKYYNASIDVWKKVLPKVKALAEK